MLLQTVQGDVSYALRQLRKSPGFAFIAVLTLALGISVNTAIFTVVNAVLLKPLTYPDADRIVQFLYPNALLNNITSIPEFHFYQRQTCVFKEVAAYDFAGPGFNLTGERPEQVRGIHVTEGFFRLFGAPVMLGTCFHAARRFTPWRQSGGVELRPVAAEVRRRCSHSRKIALVG
jgi:hypothetical protein